MTLEASARIGFSKKQCDEKYGDSKLFTRYYGSNFSKKINHYAYTYNKEGNTLTIFFYKNIAYKIDYKLQAIINEDIAKVLMVKNKSEGKIYFKLSKKKYYTKSGVIEAPSPSYYFQCDSNLVAEYYTVTPKQIKIWNECTYLRVASLARHHSKLKAKNSIEGL